MGIHYSQGRQDAFSDLRFLVGLCWRFGQAILTVTRRTFTLPFTIQQAMDEAGGAIPLPMWQQVEDFSAIAAVVPRPPTRCRARSAFGDRFGPPRSARIPVVRISQTVPGYALHRRRSEQPSILRFPLRACRVNSPAFSVSLASTQPTG